MYIEQEDEEQSCEEQHNEEDFHSSGLKEPDHEHSTGAAQHPDGGQCNHHATHGHEHVIAQRVEYADVSVHGYGEDAEDGAQEAHAEQRVHDVVYIQLEKTKGVQVSGLFKQQQDVLQSLAEAGDGVKHSQVADEAVHGGVKVPVLDDGYDHQEVLAQTGHGNDHEHLTGNLNLSAVCGVCGWSFSARVHDRWLLDCRSAEDLM